MNSKQPTQHKVPNLKYLFPTPDVLKITWTNDAQGFVYQLTKYIITNTNSLKIENEDDFVLVYEGDKQFVTINNIFPGSYCFRLRVKKPKDRHWSMDYKETFIQIDYSCMSEKMINSEIDQIIKSNDYKKLESFLSRYRSQINVDRTNEYGKTMLMEAAQNGSADVVSILLKYGANVNTSTKSGKTALLFAINALNVNCVKNLLKCKYIDVDAKDSSGTNALMHCAETSNNAYAYEIAKLLIDHGADIKASDSDGMNALDHLALSVKGGNVEVAKLFVQHGLKPYESPSNTKENTASLSKSKTNLSSKKGKSTLLSAALNGHTKFCQFLISECHCDPYQTSSSGYNGKDFATFSGYDETARLFQSIYDKKYLLENGNMKDPSRLKPI
ncbi:ankyrin [Piromyces finnis]|uniref:Ankyrin n=1 Tax=Piromyces finnis TaxID=1754191 RepID=A0A1Y1V5H2_9FUNG|nr:ankyrin [Piromyces finnis]|eukprot:ORX46864.1 ankyrin [Piromyces finnis]